MPNEQDEPDPEIEFLRTFVSERARLQAERLTAREADQAALEEAGSIGAAAPIAV
jgi:hypothetical protein